MAVTAVLGAQWGDEGKGKIVDFLAKDVDIVARFSGGNNAGHTVINDDGEFKLHLVPAGIFRSQTTCVVGNGVVVDPNAFLEEIDGLRSRGISFENRLVVSERAHLVMPYHILLDELSEISKGSQALGTTGRGIGPAYTDKASRVGIRAADLADLDSLLPRLTATLGYANAVITKVYGGEPLLLKNVFDDCKRWAGEISQFIGPVEHIVYDSIESGKAVLLEGAQGALLDLDHGTYPYVTSSHPTIGGAQTGLGLLPRHIDKVVGVMKAYSTRVGSGPFVTEIGGQFADEMRKKAHEFGTTTGRPRRIGWFDCVAARYSARVNGYTSLIMNKLDVLDSFDTIKVCNHYELDGEVVWDFPGNATLLDRCQPVYENLRGWDGPTQGATRLDQLPVEARNYVNRIEELVKLKIDIISTGPHREETIVVRPVI